MKLKRILLIISIIVLVTGILVYSVRFSGFKKKIVRLAFQELEKWKSIKETSSKASSYLVAYWRAVGIHFSENSMQSASVQNANPWSSAFISYLFFKAGAKGDFPYSASHASYFQVAKSQKNNPKAPLQGFRISEYAPKVGDLIVYTRDSSKGYDSNGFFASHGELVVSVSKNSLKAIGGNVSNKVTLSTYSLDDEGKLTRKEVPFIMVIKNNIK